MLANWGVGVIRGQQPDKSRPPIRFRLPSQRAALAFENKCSDCTQENLGGFLGIIDLTGTFQEVPSDLKRVFDEVR